MSSKKKIIIVGAGASAIALAAHLDPLLYEVHLYERNNSLARKFLVAGDGGFNLTHANPIQEMALQYEPLGFLDHALMAFSNTDFRIWLEQIGIPTYVGSSKRVFPVKPTKPIAVLQAIQKEMQVRGVQFHYKKKWMGFTADNQLLFEDGEIAKADDVVFALGGATWKVTGSDGHWLNYFKDKNIPCQNFEASNCAFVVQWPDAFQKKYAGAVLKNIQLKVDEHHSKGELTISALGVEGNAVYAQSSYLKKALKEKGLASLTIDLKPMLSEQDLLQKIQNSKAKNRQACLKEDLHLSSAAIQLLKNQMSKEAYLNPIQLAQTIKNLPIAIQSTGPLDDAISSTGGIAREAVSKQFQFHQIPHHFAIGEMLDWNAPTGGYLLQACFSMGVYLAQQFNGKNLE